MISINKKMKWLCVYAIMISASFVFAHPIEVHEARGKAAAISSSGLRDYLDDVFGLEKEKGDILLSGCLHGRGTLPLRLICPEQPEQASAMLPLLGVKKEELSSWAARGKFGTAN